MLAKLFSLDNKIAVVTGGTGVLGGAMALGLAEAGARVAIIGRRRPAGEQFVDELKRKGYQALFVQADVLSDEQLVEAREHIIKNIGSPDILVNAAGGNLPGASVPPDKTFNDINTDDFKKVVDLNILGTVLPSRIFSETMAAKKSGVIINISSMAAFRSLTRVAGYSVAKAAINNFTEWMAVEMSRKYGEGIRVNAIAPGFFLTEQNRNLLTHEDGSLTERAQTILRNTPFGRFGKPEELVGTLIWLCSDASAFVSGVIVPVDGGFNAFSGV